MAIVHLVRKQMDLTPGAINYYVAPGVFRPTVCNIKSLSVERTTEDWEKVTCKRCKKSYEYIRQQNQMALLK